MYVTACDSAELALRQSDKFGGLDSRGRDDQCLRIGVPHILARADHDATGDEAWILARFEHAR